MFSLINLIDSGLQSFKHKNKILNLKLKEVYIQEITRAPTFHTP